MRIVQKVLASDGRRRVSARARTAAADGENCGKGERSDRRAGSHGHFLGRLGRGVGRGSDVGSRRWESTQFSTNRQKMAAPEDRDGRMFFRSFPYPKRPYGHDGETDERPHEAPDTHPPDPCRRARRRQRRRRSVRRPVPGRAADTNTGMRHIRTHSFKEQIFLRQSSNAVRRPRFCQEVGAQSSLD